MISGLYWTGILKQKTNMVSDLYKIEATDKSMTLNELLEVHSKGLSIAIIEKISYAVENNIRKIDIAEIFTGSVIITLHSNSKNYRETLQSNMENLIKHEEYEMCSVAKKALETLDKRKS